jgi:hypothetical protein
MVATADHEFGDYSFGDVRSPKPQPIKAVTFDEIWNEGFYSAKLQQAQDAARKWADVANSQDAIVISNYAYSLSTWSSAFVRADNR